MGAVKIANHESRAFPPPIEISNSIRDDWKLMAAASALHGCASEKSHRETKVRLVVNNVQEVVVGSKMIVTVISLVVGSVAMAQGDESEFIRTNRPFTSEAYSAQKGFAGYLSATAGYTDSNSFANVDGMPSSFKLIGSYVSRDTSFVGDLGFGIQNQAFSDDRNLDEIVSGGVIELAGRYQFSNRWQLGGVYNQLLDNGFEYGANQGDAQFLGVQVLREFSLGDRFMGRVGARAMTCINVADNAVNMALIEFQLGWGGDTRTATMASAGSVE